MSPPKAILGHEGIQICVDITMVSPMTPRIHYNGTLVGRCGNKCNNVFQCFCRNKCTMGPQTMITGDISFWMMNSGMILVLIDVLTCSCYPTK